MCLFVVSTCLSLMTVIAGRHLCACFEKQQEAAKEEVRKRHLGHLSRCGPDSMTENSAGLAGALPDAPLALPHSSGHPHVALFLCVFGRGELFRRGLSTHVPSPANPLCWPKDVLAATTASSSSPLLFRSYAFSLSTVHPDPRRPSIHADAAPVADPRLPEAPATCGTVPWMHRGRLPVGSFRSRLVFPADPILLCRFQLFSQKLGRLCSPSPAARPLSSRT